MLIVGENAEAVILSVLFAEAGTSNYLVGPFQDSIGDRCSRVGIDEALWLLAVHRRSGRIRLLPDIQLAPISKMKNVILSSHATNAYDSGQIERMTQALAVSLSKGSIFTFTGLCMPNYTSTVLRETVEKHSGLRTGSDLGLGYLPLCWAGESIQAFKERPKIVAGIEGSTLTALQESLLGIFPSIISAPRIDAAEAAGLFSTVAREVLGALDLELARLSEARGLHYDEVLGLCKGAGMNLLELPKSIPGRDSLGSAIALASADARRTSQLIRSAKKINDDFQSRVLLMIKGALVRCGQRVSGSRIAILGLDGLATSIWSKPELPQVLQSLKRRGARVSLYLEEPGPKVWSRELGAGFRVETSILKAVSETHCAVVALDDPSAGELDPRRLALEMRRPAAICDLAGVMEASNVERAGLFYTSIGRGTATS